MTLALGSLAAILGYGAGGPAALPQQVQEVPQVGAKAPAAKPLSDDEKRKEAYYETVQANSTETLQKIAQAELLVEIDELKEMFDLPPASVKKLQLAARGAAKRTVDRARDSNKATIQRMLGRHLNANTIDLTAVLVNGKEHKVVMPDGTEPPEPDEDDPKLDKLQITLSRRGMSTYFSVRYQNGSSSTSLSPRSNDLRANAFWLKTYEKLVTLDQRRKYADHRKQRDKEIVTDLLMGVLRLELRLTSKQMPEVRKVVAESISITSSTFLSGSDYIVQRIRPQLEAAKFGKVLSKAQLDMFSAAQAYYRRFSR